MEELIRKHGDFEETIKAQEDKLEAINRITLLEKAFAQQLKQEELARINEKERLEQERFQQRKRLEMDRITKLRKQESGDMGSSEDITDEQVNGTSHLGPPSNASSPSANHYGSPRTPLSSHLGPAPVQSYYPNLETTNIGNNFLILIYDKYNILFNSLGKPTVALRKTNSYAHMLDKDRLRPLVKRAESLKDAQGSKPIKRTPSFNTKRRGSIKSKHGGNVLVLLIFLLV